MSTALVVAERLQALSEPELLALLRAREVPPVKVHDVFDLAEELLSPTSIAAALTRLDRVRLTLLSQLAVRTSAGPALTRAELGDALSGLPNAPDPAGVDALISELAALQLAAAGPTGIRSWREVADVFAHWPELGLPSIDQLATQPAPTSIHPVSDADLERTDRTAAERAYRGQAIVAELLRELGNEPARQLSKGGVGLPDARRLAGAARIDIAELPGALSVAERTGLTRLDSGHWLAADAGGEFLLRSAADRWRMLASSWQSRIPAPLSTLLADRAPAAWGESLVKWSEWMHPAGGEWLRGRITLFSRDAELLGITADGVPGSAAARLLGGDADAAARQMAAHFPEEVSTVYLQHDLTVVAPGPLRPNLDAELRLFADTESQDIAATYRITEAGIDRALAAGATATSIREFLSGISLTGIPQPLDYLLDDVSARHGRLSVGPAEESLAADPASRSIVVSADPQLLATLLVDRALAPIVLRRISENRLVSRYERDVVFWALSDARYPVVAVDHAGVPVGIRRSRTARVAAGPDRDELAELAAQLHQSANDEPAEAAWLARTIDSAIRTRSSLMVTVTMPDGSSVDYLLEPASIAGGRLRGRDRRVDIERTVPLSSIARVTAVTRD